MRVNVFEEVRRTKCRNRCVANNVLLPLCAGMSRHLAQNLWAIHLVCLRISRHAAQLVQLSVVVFLVSACLLAGLDDSSLKAHVATRHIGTPISQ